MNKAFTLIEVLVSAVLICVFSVSFTFLVTTGIRQIRDARTLTRSAIKAESMMELLRSQPYSNLFAYNNLKFDDGNGIVVVRPAGNDVVKYAVVDGKVELDSARSRF